MRTINLYIKCSTAALVVAVLAGSSGETFAPRQRFVDEQKAKGNWKNTPEGQRGKAQYDAKQWIERAKNFINGVRDERNHTHNQRQQAEALLNENHSFAGKVGGQTAQEFRRLQINLTGFKNGGNFQNGNIVLPRRDDGQRTRPRARSLGHNPGGT